MLPLSAAAAEAHAIADARDRAALVATLIRCNGAVRRAAASLGVSPDTVYRRLDRYGLRAWLDATYPLSGRQPGAGGKKKRGR